MFHNTSDYPYPNRDLEEELYRFLPMIEENLRELNYWLYKGTQDFDKGFRILTAGRGAGN